MAQKKLIKAVWELTKPVEYFLASRYRRALVYVFSVPKVVRFAQPFYVPKSGGRKRLIIPAEEDLRLVQGVLANWIVKTFPLGDDYCYLGRRGVLAAVRRHRRSGYALVVDLKDAFDSVTAEKIHHWLNFYLPKVGSEVIKCIVDFLTYQGRAPQGCVSTPYVYNLVTRPLDKGLELLLQQFGLSALTRYSDNICLSSEQPIDLNGLEDQVRRLVRGNGFELSWSHRFVEKPIIYLGTEIYRGQLGLAEEKYGEFLNRLLEAVLSPTPEIYRHQMTGTFNWTHHICGEEIPNDLLSLFARYFGKVGRTPKPLARILSQKKMRKMF